MIFTSLGSNLGARPRGNVSRHHAENQVDDTYAWRVRKVVDLPWLSKKLVTEEKGEEREKLT
jgi:hypothetical protein